MRVLLPFLLVALPGLAAPSTTSSGTLSDAATARTSPATESDPGQEADDDEWHFACDGTDPALLAEIDEAFRTRVGFGETWDESICNQGALVQGGTRAFTRRRPAAAAPTALAATAPGGGEIPPASTTTPGPAVGPATTTTAAAATATTTTAAAATATTTDNAGNPAAAATPPTAFEKRLNDQFFALAIPLMAAVAGVFAVVVAALIGLFLRLRRQVVLDVACPSCPTRIPFVVGESPQLFCPSCGAPCRVDVIGDGHDSRAEAVPL
jgi:hypothetical protein